MNTDRTDRRTRRRLGILAGLAGGLLLLGGSTYALWVDSALQAGGTITNGNLDIEAVGSPSYFDVSQDRSDKSASTPTPITAIAAHGITSISGYSIVPGDTLEATYPFAVALNGDNLVAGVSVSLPSFTPAVGVSFTARAYYLNGTTWTALGQGPTNIVSGSATTIAVGNFQAPNQPGGAVEAGAATIPIITLASIPGGSTASNFAVVVTANYASSTTNRDGAGGTSVLGNVTVSLNQTRTAGTGSFVTP